MPDVPLVCRFVPTDRHDAFSYFEALARRWDHPGPLLNCEWDVEYSRELVAGLVDCPHPLCTYAYLLYEPTTRESVPHYAQSSRWLAEGGGWIAEGERWCAWSGIGFCKVASEVRGRPLRREPWWGVESSVNEATGGGHGWHVHWPAIRHDHERPHER